MTRGACGPEHGSYLIQRLDRPWSLGAIKDNPFSFGGGLLNGGLSPEATDLLRGLFSFDYMGAAEFEWGAVPKALSGLAQRSDRLVGGMFDLPLAEVAKHWKDKSRKAPAGMATVYVLCDRDWFDEVERRIRGWAAEPFNGGLKESTHLASVLRPEGDHTPRTAGWLELDNGFMFFIDEDMWEGTCRLFGVTTPRAAIPPPEWRPTEDPYAFAFDLYADGVAGRRKGPGVT